MLIGRMNSLRIDPMIPQFCAKIFQGIHAFFFFFQVISYNILLQSFIWLIRDKSTMSTY